MRLINLTTSSITLTDIDRGIERDRDIYESWNGKADNVVPASVSTTGYIDVLDTERVLMSAELGQIKKHKTNGKLGTAYSITGRNVGTFEITGLNNTFEVQVGTDAIQSITLPSGSAVSMADIVSAITLSATGLNVEESNRFFRSSNTDDVTGNPKDVVEGAVGYNYGPRGAAIISGFLVLWGTTKITIGAGTANATLGFYDNESTLAG